jgi:hypothetical protein
MSEVRNVLPQGVTARTVETPQHTGSRWGAVNSLLDSPGQ